MSVRDRSRYFCFEVDEALDYSGDDIIRAIQKRYPTTNYILVRGKNDWNKQLVKGVWVRTIEYCWKIVWIQQTQNALDRDTVVRCLSKDLPGTQIMKRCIDDQEVSNTATQYVASWGEFHPPSVRKDARKKLKAQAVAKMSDDEKVATIVNLFEENDRLKKEMNASVNSNSITLNSLVNSNNTTTNNTNNMNITVNIGNPYGFEPNTHVTPEQWKSIIAEGIQKGLAHLTCQTIDVIHSVDENKNFYMTQSSSENVKVLRHGNVYEDVLLEKFARDAPYHYAEIVKEASNEDALAIDDLKEKLGRG